MIGLILFFVIAGFVIFGVMFIVGIAVGVSDVAKPKKVSKDYVPEKVGAPEVWG